MHSYFRGIIVEIGQSYYDEPIPYSDIVEVTAHQQR